MSPPSLVKTFQLSKNFVKVDNMKVPDIVTKTFTGVVNKTKMKKGNKNKDQPFPAEASS
jgi:hypothetical protein